MAIESFKDKTTEAINYGEVSKQTRKLLPAELTKKAQIKLAVLGAATSLNDLMELRGNRFEALKGDRKGQFSIRINDQYRICFEWRDNNAYNVEYGLSLKENNMSHITPIHPGMVLQDELEEIGVSQSNLARHIGVLPKTINEICNGKRGISAPMAWKLSKAVGASPQFWLNLQNNWELSQINEVEFNRLEKIAA